MIEDARALEVRHVPQDLEHRDGQIDTLAAELRPIEKGLSGDHTFIFGPSGSGKTTLAQFASRQLTEEAIDVRSAYHNCMSASSKTDVLHGLVDDGDLARHLQRDGVPASRYLDCFRDVDGHVVVILDEVDVLDDPTTLIALSELGNVTIVAITIDEDDFFASSQFNGRVKSRFSRSQKIQLRKYRQHELEDILWARVEAGLKPGVVGDGVIAHMADLAAGDAREGVILLRRAVKHVIGDERSQITVADVDAVEDSAREEKRQEHIHALGTHKRLLYDIIERAGEIGAGELRKTYEERSSNPKGDSTRGRYLAALEDKYELIESSGSTRAKVYRVTGAS
ncbi:orc1/cdc6 family replication initiation protein [Halobacteria archaeon AArc-dxtr1]|nr:orc1/cdc6 family replication initiation protein [Halobacteria archaeon AArc-dxtr1]